MATHQNVDYLNPSNRGDLTDPAQSKSFVVDPFLTPVTHNSHPILPDPSPSTDPTMFDASTSHPNNHYHPEKKLGKKKKAKKFGIGSTTINHPHPHHSNASNTHAAATFTEYEMSAEERKRKMEEKQRREEDHQNQHQNDENDEEEEEEEEESRDETIDKTEKTIKPPNANKEYVTQSTTGSSNKESSSTDNKSNNKSSSLLGRAGDMASSVMNSTTGVVNAALSKVGLNKDNNKDNDKDRDTTNDKEQMDQRNESSANSTKGAADKTSSAADSTSKDQDSLSTPSQKDQSNDEPPRKTSIGGMMASATATATGMFNSVLTKVGFGGNKAQSSSDETTEGTEKVEK